MENKEPGKILSTHCKGAYVVRLSGDVRLSLCHTMDEFLATILGDPDFNSILVDLSRVDSIDSTALGMLAKLAIETRRRRNHTPILISTNSGITRILLSMGLDTIFHIRRKRVRTTEDLKEWLVREGGPQDTHQKVLEAHQHLLSLKESNRERFEDLIKLLESAG